MVVMMDCGKVTYELECAHYLSVFDLNTGTYLEWRYRLSLKSESLLFSLLEKYFWEVKRWG
jgi:nitrite reductase/ring-hydroxylating ferredoxin subunit